MTKPLPTFRVTEDCTGCAACEAAAPHHFEPGERGLYRCFAQPRGEPEIERCREAKECCPVDAIEEITSR